MSRRIAPAICVIATVACGFASSTLSSAGEAGAANPSTAEQSARPRNDRKPPETAEELFARFESAAPFWQQADAARALIALNDANIIPRVETPPRSRSPTEVQCRLRPCRTVGRKGPQAPDRRAPGQDPRPTDLIRSDGRADREGQIREDRYYSALLLGQLREKTAVPALIEATADKSINDRVAISLGEIGDKRAIPALRKMAEESPDQKLWAGYGLAALGEQEGFDLLTEAALSDSRWTQRRHAIEALGKIGESRAVPAIIKALQDEHLNVRVSAAIALGQIGDPAGLRALTETLNDTETTTINAPTMLANEARKAIEAIRSRKK